MAFGVDREELTQWKERVSKGQIAFLTHYWLDDRFPGCDTVTKVGCRDVEKLKRWGAKHGLQPNWIHQDDQYPHYDLFGDVQARILSAEGIHSQIKRFNIR
ncbi:hypothetical protein [Thalassobacillus sp. B23F22_16]|uniref:hypothetical protein n=1 Tax=Thalassobacillus sp. B23F22_16 TaxID=3459513 RepID=UPI00373ED0B1